MMIPYAWRSLHPFGSSRNNTHSRCRLARFNSRCLPRVASGTTARTSSSDADSGDQIQILNLRQPEEPSSVPEEASTSGRSAAEPSPPSSNGHVADPIVAGIPRSHSMLEPTQSWGGEEDPPEAKQTVGDKASKPKGGGGLAKRVIFGILMGVAGASAVLSQQLFLIAAALVTYQATIEYYSMVRRRRPHGRHIMRHRDMRCEACSIMTRAQVTSKGITKGMAPPPPLVSWLTTLLCISMVARCFFFQVGSCAASLPSLGQDVMAEGDNFTTA